MRTNKNTGNSISCLKKIRALICKRWKELYGDLHLKGNENFLGGKSTSATILFSDIRGFTTLTEELGAQGTVSFLNEYFTIMVECIQREEGFLDKFIGDAILAAFGIPIAHDDDEDRGVRTAISMINEVNTWNLKRMNDGKRPVEIGIGLNTDTVVSGNIGSPKHMEYTMIGDGVNLAARLESACKQYSARILISENTCKKLRGTYCIRQIDRILVKGKTEPVVVYEVLDYHSEETFPNLMEVLSCFEKGLAQYHDNKWDKAIESFSAALNLNPTDRISQLYIERCKVFMVLPPGEDWDGVFKALSK